MKTVLSKIKSLGLPILFILAGAVEANESAFGPFVEPSLTYESGSTEANFPSPISHSTGSADGLGIGARVGFHFSEIFFAGLDGRYSRPNFTDSSVNYDASAVAANWGPVVGIQLPIIGLRAWASYVAGASLDPEKSGSFDVNFKDGSGYRIGAGYKIAMVSLNLEYQQLSYDETSLEQLGPFSTNTSLSNVKLKNDSWIVSVSFPYAL